MLMHLLTLPPIRHRDENRRTYGPAVADRDPVGVKCSDTHGHKMGWGGCIEACPLHSPYAYAAHMAQHRADR